MRLTTALKQLTAILLLALLLFNWCGYRLVTAIMSQKATLHLEKKIDRAQYEDSDLIELRIPLEVPYQLNQSDFERSYGEVEVNGRVYTHVKRRVEAGQLILLCLPNEHREQIEGAAQDFYKNTNGLDHLPGDKQGKAVQKYNSGDYDDRLPEWNLSQPGQLLTSFPKTSADALPQVVLLVPAQPPETVTL